MRQPGKKGIELHGLRPCFGKTGHQDDARNLIFSRFDGFDLIFQALNLVKTTQKKHHKSVV